MRNFAAATLAAVAAALLGVCGFVVLVVGSVEASGGLVGRMSIAMTDLPYGPTTAEHIETLHGLAARDDVGLALLVPDRAARAGVWTAHVIRGEPAPPVFRGRLDVRPIAERNDLDLRTTYAVDGPDASTRDFLDQMDRAGYRFDVVTPNWPDAVALAVSSPTTAAALVVTSLGVVVALIAESVRRAPRQRLRRNTGWSRWRVALREAAEAGVPVGVLGAVCVAGFLVFLGVRQASGPVLDLAVTIAIGAVATSGGAIVLVHVALSLWWTREGVAARPVQSLRPVVAVIAAVLLVVAVVDFRIAGQQRAAADSLEPSLRTAAEHGDDVVLGTGFTTFEQDVAFGELALGPLRRSEAGLAKAPIVEHVTVAGAMPVPLRQFAAHIARAGPAGEPVLLVPDARTDETAALREAALRSLRDGWEIEGARSPRALDVRTLAVPSTAAVTTAVLDWAGETGSASPTGPDVPVLVIQDPTDLAPNRIGTAVANGEVRFQDRDALDEALTDAGLSSSVLQVRRVGAIVEGKLAALRADRRASETTGIAALAVLGFAMAALVVDHRVRSRRAGRLLALVGRHPALEHRRFVSTSTGMTFVLVTSALAVTAVPLRAATAGGFIAAITVGVVLVCLLAFTVRSERNPR